MKNIDNKTLYACILLSSSFNTHSFAASIDNLLISEVMANPAMVSDSNGEWFELFNSGLSAINLQGLKLSDDGSNSHVISAEQPLWVSPGQYFVLAKNADSNSNGGFFADYEYNNFTLGNSSDQIIFSNDLSEILRLNYASDFASAGQSMELLSLPMTQANFALSLMFNAYGLGDIGTPGLAGRFNPTPVPLPAAIWLFGGGLIGMFGISRRGKTS